MYQKMTYSPSTQNKDHAKPFDYKRDERGSCSDGKTVYKKLQVIIKMIMKIF